MPIVDVELVADAVPPADLAQTLADALGTALSSAAGRTWVRLRRLDPSDYAENGGAGPDVGPVFVTVVERVRPTGEAFVERVARVTEAVATVTGRDPEQVHVLFEADAAGRVAFGGRPVE